MEVFVDPRTGRRIFPYSPAPDRSNEVYNFYLYDPNHPEYNGPYNLYETSYPSTIGWAPYARNFMETHPPLYVVNRYGRELDPPYRTQPRPANR